MQRRWKHTHEEMSLFSLLGGFQQGVQVISGRRSLCVNHRSSPGVKVFISPQEPEQTKIMFSGIDFRSCCLEFRVSREFGFTAYHEDSGVSSFSSPLIEESQFEWLFMLMWNETTYLRQGNVFCKHWAVNWWVLWLEVLKLDQLKILTI